MGAGICPVDEIVWGSEGGGDRFGEVKGGGGDRFGEVKGGKGTDPAGMGDSLGVLGI